jgi:type IV secretory pathway component VirB8
LTINFINANNFEESNDNEIGAYSQNCSKETCKILMENIQKLTRQNQNLEAKLKVLENDLKKSRRNFIIAAVVSGVVCVIAVAAVITMWLRNNRKFVIQVNESGNFEEDLYGRIKEFEKRREENGEEPIYINIRKV